MTPQLEEQTRKEACQTDSCTGAAVPRTDRANMPAHTACPLSEVPLWIDSPCSSAVSQPITVGIPFARGALTDPDALTLGDAEGRQASLQTVALARWADGSVQWLLLDFVAQAVVQGRNRWTLSPSAQGQRQPSRPLRVEESSSGLVIDTGVATFRLDRTQPTLLQTVTREGHDVLEPGSFRAVLTDAKGRPGGLRLTHLQLEARGPVRATVRLEGVFEGRVPCRFVARLCFFAQTGLVRLRLMLHNPKRARHRAGLWDLGDPGSMFFRDLSVELKIQDPGHPRLSWAAEVGHESRSGGPGDLEVYQDSSGGENWRSKNHVNRHGEVPCSFRGYRLRHAQGETQGLRASPLVALQGISSTTTVAVPEFWQQFPKALEVKDRQLSVRLFPGQFGDLFELQGGEQKTHTVWFHFGGQDAPTTAALAWVHQPARAHASPDWYAASGVIPYLAPAPEKPGDRLEAYLADVVEGPKSFFARREIIDEYGWRNYGEVYADHEEAHYKGPRPVISHYNNQYDSIYGTLVQYLRTGESRWFDLCDPLARHVMDIDIYHTDQDKAAYNGGLFWLTDHYKGAATCTHRTYSRANSPADGSPYGGGPGSAHNFTTGLLHYYYLTGDPSAREAVLSLANWVVQMEDGSKNILGLLDDGPTGLASFTAHVDYHGPGRGCGNSVNALLDAWLVTGLREYLDRAEGLIRRSVHPADDVAGRNLLDAERRWSSTMFFSILARYLSLKAEAGERDSMYAYVQASLLHYASWMLENERPYFDHPENLEYPTETWAAQELRKANVLRLAAAHAEDPLRTRLLTRSQELAERGWRDLLRFESRTVVRAVAIVLAEGPKDSFFQIQGPERAPEPFAKYDFGVPGTFVSQRLRVRAQLKTVRGILRALLRLANPQTWRRLLG